MITCPYGQCTMRNLCKSNHCVRQALERSGWVRTPDGTLELRNKGFTPKPEWLDDPKFPYPIKTK